MEYTKTELHTHLVGMLSAEEFVNFIKKCGIMSFCFSNSVLSPDDLLSDKYYRLIQIETRIPYSKMNNLYSNRTEIIKSIVDEYSKMYNTSKSKASFFIYNLLINESLRSLVKQGVKYVEISYSFHDRINNFIIDSDLKDKIKCKFLLSTQRKTVAYSNIPGVHTFQEAAKNLAKVLKGGHCVGFDIMGEETKLTDDELDYNDKMHSFMFKLELLFDTLLQFNNTTLRIHSGETSNSFTNTTNILKMIEVIAQKRKIVIPPPEIRIGHGLYFDANKEYVDLLKKFHCIIEINASSNIRLSNVESYKSIPYNFYLSHGIPIVICTDSHGINKTTIKKEDKIARVIVGDEKYEKIVSLDKEILLQKGK